MNIDAKLKTISLYTDDNAIVTAYRNGTIREYKLTKASRDRIARLFNANARDIYLTSFGKYFCITLYWFAYVHLHQKTQQGQQ
jgi:hypothetical protein